LHFVFIKIKEITELSLKMPQEHLLQVSPEIAANEMLLKEPWKTTKDCSKKFNMLLF
jgi:hypothetical protein